MASRPRGDSSVSTAVGLITANKESLMLARYGLNALGDLVMPPKLKFRDNAADALQCGDGAVVEALNSLAAKAKAGSHDEQCLAIVNIIDALFQAVEFFPNLGLQGIMKNRGVAPLLTTLATQGPGTPEFLAVLVPCVDKAARAGFVPIENAAQIVEGFSVMLEDSSKWKDEEARERATVMLCGLAANNATMCAKLAQHPVVPELASKFAEHANYKDKATYAKVELCLKFLAKANEQYLRSNATLEEKSSQALRLQALVDNQSQKKLGALAQAAVANLFAEEEMFAALQVVADPDADEDFKLANYAVLGCMSASMEGCAAAIVNAGAIPVLLRALSETAGNVEASGDPAHEKALCTILTLLARVAHDKTAAAAMVEAGTLDILETVWGQLDHTEHFESSCLFASVLAAICQDETTASDANDRGLTTTLLEFIHESCSQEEFGAGPIMFLQQLAAYPSLMGSLLSASAFEYLLEASGYHLDDDGYQLGCHTTLAAVSEYVADLIYAHEAGAMVFFASSVAHNAGEPAVGRLALETLGNVSSSANAETCLGNAHLVGAVSLVVYTLNELRLTQRGNEILTAIVTREITQQIVQQNSVSQWQTASLDALTQLASIATIFSLPGPHADDALRSEAMRLITTLRVDDMFTQPDLQLSSVTINQRLVGTDTGSKLYGVALDAGGSVMRGFSDTAKLQSTLTTFVQVLNNAQLHKYILASYDTAGILCKGVASVGKALATNNVTEKGPLSSTYNGLFTIFGVFDESRAVTLAIHEALGDMLTAPNGADVALSVEGPKFIVRYVRKSKLNPVPFVRSLKNTRLQIEGCSTKPDAVGSFKREGTLQVILSGVKECSADLQVRGEAAKVIPLLMDAAEAKEAATNFVKNLVAACESTDGTREETLISLLAAGVGICASPAVAKEVVAQGGGEALKQVVGLRDSLAAPANCEIVADTMGVCCLLVSAGSGNKLKQLNMFESAVQSLNFSQTNQHPAGIGEAARAARLLYEWGRHQELISNSKVVTTVCKAISIYSETHPTVVESCGALLQVMALDSSCATLVTGNPQLGLMLQGAAEAFNAADRDNGQRPPLLVLAMGLGVCDPATATSICDTLNLAQLSQVLDNDDLSGSAFQTLRGLGSAGNDHLREAWDYQTGVTELTTFSEVVEERISRCVEPDAAADIVEALNRMVLPDAEDPAVRAIATGQGLGVMLERHEASHPRLATAAATLFASLPPGDSSIAGYIAAAVESYNSEDMTSFSRQLLQIETALRLPMEDPATALATVGELMACVSGTLDSGDRTAQARSVKLVHSLATRFPEINALQSLAENEGLPKLLAITAKTNPLSQNGAAVRHVAEIVVQGLVEPEMRELMLEAHAASPLDLNLLKDYDREPTVHKSLVDMLGRILAEPSEHNKALLANPEWRERVFSMLNDIPAGKRAQLLDGMLQAGTRFSAKEGARFFESLSDLNRRFGDEDAAPVSNSHVNALIRKLLERPEAREPVLKLMGTLGQKLKDCDDPGSFDQHRYLVNTKLLMSDDMEYMPLENELLTHAMDMMDAAAPAEVISAGLAPITTAMASTNPERAHAAALQLEAEGIPMLERLLGAGDNEGYPLAFGDTEATNAVLKIVGLLINDEAKCVELAMNPDLLAKLAMVSQAPQDDQTDNLLTDLEARLAEVYTPDGDMISVTFRDGEVKQSMGLKHLEGAPDPEELTVRHVFGFLKSFLTNSNAAQLKREGNEQFNHFAKANANARGPKQMLVGNDGIISPVKDGENKAQLLQYFEFVWEKLSSYTTDETLTVQMFHGDEIKWGCLCWALWLENDPDTAGTLVSWAVHDQLLLANLVYSQEAGLEEGAPGRRVDVCTPASIALDALASVSPASARLLADSEGIQEMMHFNLRSCLDDPVTCVANDHMLPRLKLIQHVAVDRRVFVDVTIQHLLQEVWDSVDAGSYNDQVLRHVFRCIRRTLHPSHAPYLKDVMVCKRLLDCIRRATDNPLIVDAFFLLGILAGFPVFRDAIADDRGADVCLKVLNAHLSDAPHVGVITNVLSALGNIVVDHRRNTDRFVELGGLQQVVWVLRNRTAVYGELNAAAALIANSSYRRDDVKAMYGSANVGGPAALANAIKSYDGSQNDGAYRALTTLFKAIANLALYTPNIKPIVDNGLDEAYFAIFNQSDILPDRVLNASLLTLSNISQEYSDETSEKFQPLMEAMFRTGQMESHQNAEFLGLVLDITSLLCRYPENAEAINQIDGAGFILTALQTFGLENSDLIRYALSATGQCVKSETFIEAFLAYDGLNNLLSVLNGDYFQEEESDVVRQEVAQLAFRCVRKLIVGYQWPETWAEYCQGGFTATWAWWLEQLGGLPDPPSTVVTEALNIGAGLVRVLGAQDADRVSRVYPQLFGEPSPPDAEQGTMPNYVFQDSPTFLELMGLDEGMIGSLLYHIATLAESEASKQNKRGYACALYVMIMVMSYLPTGEWQNLIGGEQDYVIGHVITNLCMILDSVSNEGILEAWELIAQLIINLAYSWNRFHVQTAEGAAFELRFGKQSDFRKNFAKNLARMTNKASRKILEKFASTLWDKLEVEAQDGETGVDGDVDAAGQLAKQYCQLHVDADRLTLWDRESYPNGVQDLPFKEILRRGGKCEMLDSTTNLKVGVYWRANQPLRQLQWKPIPSAVEKQKVGSGGGLHQEAEAAPTKERRHWFHRNAAPAAAAEGGGGGGAESAIVEAGVDLGPLEFTQQIQVGRLRATRGGESAGFKAFGMGGVSGLAADRCLALVGPATADNPAGEELSLIFSGKAERDCMFNFLNEWKRALS